MGRQLYLYNTATRQKEAFEPRGQVVGMYCCGPTVYNYAHIGNLRAYICEDVLRRGLESFGYEVRHVMNITDVGHLTSDADEGEDKMLKGARREGRTPWEIARFYEKAFFVDADSLGIERPHVACRATEHIDDMITLVKRIEENGYTYVADGNVYFDVSRFPRYPELARLNLEQMRAGARVGVDSAKRNAADFVLWFTRSKFGDQEMQWDSPWGRGFPGWHLECSAMSIKYLGEQFDIHCGGIDHIPVHHTNEIAQAESATGKHPWVKYWVHNEFVVMGKGKMAKSGEGFVTLASLKERGLDPLAYRLFCFSAHYRSPVTFSFEGVESSAQSLKRLRSLVPQGEGGADKDTVERALAPFWDAVADDLNMPKAVAAVWDLLQSDKLSPEVKRECARRADSVLGLDLLREEQQEAVREVVVDEETVRFVGGAVDAERMQQIARKAAERAAARKKRDFATADTVRDELQAQGITVKDLPGGVSECRVS
ncbi:MAG: cysteine--tRNA ligase [Chitinivibrionales bacterium]|nr:cysteine--tRNA ligase [Chitinivibrionales bacterium]